MYLTHGRQVNVSNQNGMFRFYSVLERIRAGTLRFFLDVDSNEHQTFTKSKINYEQLDM
jgi:hypothetical protein